VLRLRCLDRKCLRRNWERGVLEIEIESYDVKAECGPWVVQVTSNFHNVCMGYVGYLEVT
jgi:hypothetical protein